MKRVKKVIGIKCFDMDLTCRGFQFELGKTYKIKGKLAMCENGFHFYHHSQMKYVFTYYHPVESRYCLVIGENVIMDEEKSVARKITILKELSLSEVINIRTRKMAKQDISENQDKYYGIASQTGNYGLADQTGDYGIASQTGYRGSAMQTGDQGLAGQTGEHGIAHQIGYNGLAGQTRKHSIAIQKGNRGVSIQTGIDGSAVQDGEYGMAIATGINGRAMVLNDKGAIVIQNWIYSYVIGCWRVIGRLSAGVGDTLPNGETMATNTWYWYEDGILNSKKNKK